MERRVFSRMRRSGLVATCVLLAIAACSSPAARVHSKPTPNPSPVRHVVSTAGWLRVSRYGVTFSYPARWFQNTDPDVSSVTDAIFWVSTQPLHDPCTRTVNTVTCGWPLATLRPDAVLVEWMGFGMPGWSFDRAAGSPDTVGGKTAKVQVDTSDARSRCSDIGAEHALVAVIPSSVVQDNATEFIGCMRGPDTSVQMDVAWTILHSAQIEP